MILGGYHVAYLTPAIAMEPTPQEKRIHQLESRISELEKTVKQLQEQIKQLTQSAQPKGPGLDAKVIGSWGATASGKEGLTALRLERDGSCKIMALKEDKHLTYKGRYEIIGNMLDCRVTHEGTKNGYQYTLRVISVTDKELVIRSKMGNTAKDPEPEVRLERQ
jgi:uncharacterized protein (TIGR03066 family)